MYKYLQMVIPGFGMFHTTTYGNWIDGFKHPFLAFFKSLDIYHGGLPSVSEFYAVKKPYSYENNLPRHVAKSGKGNTDESGHYYEYFGSKYVNLYGSGYN